MGDQMTRRTDKRFEGTVLDYDELVAALRNLKETSAEFQRDPSKFEPFAGVSIAYDSGLFDCVFISKKWTTPATREGITLVLAEFINENMSEFYFLVVERLQSLATNVATADVNKAKRRLEEIEKMFEKGEDGPL